MTSECIESIKKIPTNHNYEIILVDNASTDDSKLKFSCRDDIKYIYNTSNLGFGQANNIGARYASGKYLFFLNSDTYIKENVLDKLYDYMEKKQEYAACGAQLLWPNGKLQRSVYQFPDITEMLKIYLSPSFSYKDSNILISSIDSNHFICGAAIFIRTSIFKNIGGFYEKYFMYYEETDLFYNLKKKGYSFSMLNTVSIFHYNGGSQTGTPTNKRYNRRRYIFKYQNYIKSRKLYFSRNIPKDLTKLKLIMTLGSIIRIHNLRSKIFSTIRLIWKNS